MTTEGLRKRRVNHFVQVPRATVRDDRMSYRAFGLLTYLLDMPDGWDVRSEVLSSADGREGREAIRTALRELARLGYYRLERRRLRDGRNVMGTAVSEVPVASWAAESAEFDGKAVPVIEQEDHTFKVRHGDGTLTDDGFQDTATGDGIPGAGSPGPGSPDAGQPDAGNLGALRETVTGDLEDSDDPPLRSGSSAAPITGSSQPHAKPVDSASGTALALVADPGTLAIPVDHLYPAVDRLCEHLADRVETNGSKRPTITKAWRDAARLLMDVDGRTEEQVHRAIDFSQDDEFWRINILSMPKLRQQYDRLRLTASRPRATTDQRVLDARALADRYRAQEVGNA